MTSLASHRKKLAKEGRIVLLDSPSPKQLLAIQALRQLIAKKTGHKDVDGRAIICTPCDGNYTAIVAWVIAVEGSPPRGIIYAGDPHYSPPEFYLIDEGKSRRLGNAQAWIVRTFLAQVIGRDPAEHITDAVPIVVVEHWTVEATESEVLRV